MGCNTQHLWLLCRISLIRERKLVTIFAGLWVIYSAGGGARQGWCGNIGVFGCIKDAADPEKGMRQVNSDAGKNRMWMRFYRCQFAQGKTGEASDVTNRID
jgi:hypothetical protein